MSTHVGNAFHPKDIKMSSVAANFIGDDEEFENSDTSQTELQNAATQDENPEDRENYKKRYSDLKSHYDTAITAERQAKEQLRKELENERKSKSTMAPPKTAEELEAFKKEWPDIFDAISSIAIQNVSTVKEELQEDILEIRREKEKEALALGRQRVLAKHPDFETIVKSQEFNDWFASKSTGVQALINSSDPTDLIEGLDIYALETGTTKKTKSKSHEQSLEASMAVDLNSGAAPDGQTQGKIWRESEIDAQSRKDQHWFERNEAEIEKAYNEGRVLIGQ